MILGKWNRGKGQHCGIARIAAACSTGKIWKLISPMCTLIWVSAIPLQIQLPTNASGKKNRSWTKCLSHYTHAGDPDETLCVCSAQPWSLLTFGGEPLIKDLFLCLCNSDFQINKSLPNKKKIHTQRGFLGESSAEDEIFCKSQASRSRLSYGICSGCDMEARGLGCAR